MAYEITWEADGLYCNLFGRVSISDVVKSIEDETADPRYVLAHYRITDLMHVTEHSVTLNDAEGLATIDSARKNMNPRLLDAIVVTDPFISKIAQVYSANSDRSDLIEVFANVGDARIWLSERLGEK
jgi:hypothetical protein